MKTQLELLVKLQSCDAAISTAQKIQENHPLKIKHLEEGLEKKREILLKQQQQLEEIKKKRIRKEQDLAAEEEKVNRAKQKLATVKTNKEYQASLKEIENIEKCNSKIEEEILLIMEEVDNLTKQRDKTEEQFKLVEKETEDQKRKLDEQIKESIQVIEANQKKKEEYIAQIKDEILDLYQKIKLKRPELTVVPVDNSCCLGCHMNIPPQLFNEVKKCQKIIRCPHCSRILYWKKNHETLPGMLQPEPQ